MTGPQPGRLPIEGRSRTLVLAALVVGAVLIVAYWALWFTARDVVASDTTQSYYDFEDALPLGDAWLRTRPAVVAPIASARTPGSSPSCCR